MDSFDIYLWGGILLCFAALLLLPWGLKALARKLFHRRMSYFASFFIVLATSMILSGILSYLFPHFPN